VGDLVIKGGTVHDGAGSPSFRADVQVTGSTITAIGENLEGDITLDATGCVVAPAFIDIHTHYDAQVFWDPLLTPSCWHGVTTVVAGNCGFSIAPVRAEHRELMIDTLRIVEDMNGDTLRTGVPWRSFETYPEYLDAVAARGVRLNFAGYVGHTAVRLFVMGEEAFERSATPAEIDSMREIVRQALLAGAVGFSTSSTPAHRGAGGRPVPSRSADLAEMLALTEPLRDEDRGVVSLVAGERIGYADVFTLQRHVNRPLTWTPLLVMPGFDHGYWLKANSDARAAGQDVWGQTTCRPIVFQETLGNPFTLQRFPAFAALAGVNAETRSAAYRDVSWRRRANAEANDADPPYNWSAVVVGETDGRPELIGRSVVDLAGELGCTPLDVMLDVALADDLRTRFNVAVANADAEAVAPLLQSKGVLIGLADSGAHVGQLCDACFATDLLATWSRTRGTLSLGEAIRKLTGEPAAFLGLTDRGLLAPGLAADICVFDPETVAPGRLRRIRDFPADGERLVADAPVGVRHVLVNGTPIRRDGADVNVAARPGRVLGRAALVVST
jgi:N-acyl-D-aspartate/D-glutamate deacylase